MWTELCEVNKLKLSKESEIYSVFTPSENCMVHDKTSTNSKEDMEDDSVLIALLQFTKVAMISE